MFHDREFRSAIPRRVLSNAVRPAVPARRGVSGDDALDRSSGFVTQRDRARRG
jgi:hypothetical protein